MKLKEMLRKAERIPFQNNTCNISVLSNITLDPYLIPFLKMNFAELKMSVNILTVCLENYPNEIDKIKDSDLIVVLANFEYQFPNWYNDILSNNITARQFRTYVVRECRRLYHTLKTNTFCPIIWFGYEFDNFRRISVCGSTSVIKNTIDSINADICYFFDDNDSHIDMRYLIGTIGITNSFDHKSKYRWNAPYSQQMIQAISDEIYKQYMIQKGITKKCLVLDCDGVLWGGILSEDGIDQIILGNEGEGRPYQDFQRFLLTLYYHGVILAICSKNDLKDVLRVFREHNGMVLKEEHIACFKVNWEPKPNNLKILSQELNIELDSMVLIDDSEFEIHSVEAMLPEVNTVLFNRDTVYDKLSFFKLKSVIDIDTVRQRNETYNSNIRREILRSKCSTYNEYISLIEMKIEIHLALPTEIARISELSQRANKCTNGIRYTTEQLKKKMQDDDYLLYSVSVTDRFSNLGIVGVIGICNDILDLFVLSCRALGRKVEESMLDHLTKHTINSYRFISTSKNSELLYIFKTRWKNHHSFDVISKKAE